MTPSTVLDIAREALLVVLWVSLPVVIVSTVTALLIAVLQAVTQIQDQSIGQSVRFIAVLVGVVLTAGVLGREVLRFAERTFQLLTTLP